MQAQGDQPPAAGDRKRIVKRYSNRKLYDTRESRYVTLLQIAEMVRAGEEVQIIDNATKDDLTEVTLAQIIYEEQKQHSRSVPLQTLRDLIHQRGEKLMSQLREGPLGRLLPTDEKPGGEAVETVTEAKIEEATAVVPDEHSTYGGTPGKDEKKGILDQSREAFEALGTRIDERVRSALHSFSPFQQLQDEVSRLKERIDELEARLEAEKKPGRSKKD